MPPKNASTSVTPRERSEAPARAPGASPESYAATGPDVISAPPSQAHQRVELLAREHARVPARSPTPPNHQQRGDRPDAESLGRHRGAVGVELRDQPLTLVVAGEVVEDRRHDLARTAPVGVAVDDDRHIGAAEDALHRRVGGGDRPIQQDRPPAAAALRTIGEAGQAHGIERPAERARLRRPLAHPWTPPRPTPP